MPDLAELVTHLLNGVVLGLLYALIALGFMLILGTMEVINFSHGVLFALGGYSALALGPHVGWWGALLLAPVIVGGVGLLLELGVRRTYGRDPLFGLLFTFGAALALEEIIRIVWGPRGYTVSAPAFVAGPFHWGFLFYSKYRVLVAVLAVLLLVLVWAFLERSPYGAMIKAGAHDHEMVRALGINLSRLRLFVFSLGTALAAVAGVIMAPIWGIRPHVGVDAVVPAFLIIVLGGVGSLWGAVIAGLLVGLVVGLTGAYASEWSLMSMYLLFIAVVTFRARGLFGKKSVLEV